MDNKSSLSRSFRNIRQRLWRSMVVAILSAVAAMFGQRGYATAVAQDTVEQIWMTTAVTTKQQQPPKQQQSSLLSTSSTITNGPKLNLPSPKFMSGAVLVAAGAGGVLGWNLVQNEKIMTTTTPTPVVKVDNEEEETKVEDDDKDSNEKVPIITDQGEEDETSRLRAQKFVDSVLSRIKAAQRKALSTLSSSSSEPTTPAAGESPASSSKSKGSLTLGTASYLESLSGALTRESQTARSTDSVETPNNADETVPSSAAASSVSPPPSQTRSKATGALQTTDTTIRRSTPPNPWSNVSRRRKYVKARQQPKSPSEEDSLAQKYAALSVPDRAYQILLDLGMIETSSSDSNDGVDDNKSNSQA